MMSAEWYAEKRGWALLKANLMVEGNLDVRYLSLANALYLEQAGRALVGKDLSVFAAGTGDAGGTPGILEELPTLFQLASVDLDSNGKRKFRVATLLDRDIAGLHAASVLPKMNRSLRLYGEIFLLHRVLPRRAVDPLPLAQHIDQENAKYGSLHCEIEDLLNEDLVDLFMAEHPQYAKTKQRAEDGFHINWCRDGKHRLADFVRQYGALKDVSRIVDAIKSLRFYLRLPPEGVEITD